MGRDKPPSVTLKINRNWELTIIVANNFFELHDKYFIVPLNVQLHTSLISMYCTIYLYIYIDVQEQCR